MSNTSSLHDLKTLIRSYHPLIVVETVEESRVQELLLRVVADVDLPLFEWSVTSGLIRYGKDRPIGKTNDPHRLLRHIASTTLDSVYLLKDFAKHLDQSEIVREFRELLQSFSERRSTFVLTQGSIDLPSELEHHAVHFRMEFADREEIHKTVVAVVRSVAERQPVETKLSRSELEVLLRTLNGLTLHEVRQVITQALVDDGRLSADDVRLVLNRKVQIIREGGLLEFYPQEDNAFELGGFARLKSWLERAKVGLTPEAADLNLEPPKGLLLVGVQGCGKSLAAKVIAREWDMPLLKLDAGRLMDKYLGESEKNLRRAIALAESMAPVVLWIDELEKSFSSPGSSSEDGGSGLRVLATFLTWLQEKKKEVFVAATANDLSRLPPEFLRKGRFDEIFFVDLPVSEERKEVFEIHLRLRRQTAESFDLDRLVEGSDGFSGAEIEQVVIGGLYEALHQKQPLDTEILAREISNTVPLSVSRREDIELLRATARERFVPVR